MAKDEVGGGALGGVMEGGRTEWVGFGTEQGSESVSFEPCIARDVRRRSRLSVTSRFRETCYGMESPFFGAAFMRPSSGSDRQ